MRFPTRLAAITGFALVVLLASPLLSEQKLLKVKGAHAAPRIHRPHAVPLIQRTRAASLTRFHARYRDLLADNHRLVRIWTIHYRAHNGARRAAYVVLPRWYGPKHDPAIPLVISPHGRGIPARKNVRIWGGLPAFGPFAVVNPEGQGRELALYSWGDPGQIADLARMPRIVASALAWLRIDPRRIYAAGGSMGGQETLLLAARYPHLLAGAAAFDSATNLAARYQAFPELRFGLYLQQLARIEVGGTPATQPRAYALRSPLDSVRALAFSGVPLQIWWSTRDRIVVNQRAESGLLYRELKHVNPGAPVRQFVGQWRHTAEMKPLTRLPLALVHLGLIHLHTPLPIGLQ
jgi:poly(3-hydroxybutyrate) depolymerase